MITLDSSPVRAGGRQPIFHPLADLLVQTDEQLMIQVKQRSIAALETLYDRYAETEMSLAFRILGDRDLAEQMLVEAFWHIWGHPYQYQWTRGSFSDLFSGMIWHLALDELDSRQIRPLQ
jgi:RNA polymerase sigma-70 factor (ECF subfamily)